MRPLGGLDQAAGVVSAVVYIHSTYGNDTGLQSSCFIETVLSSYFLVAYLLQVALDGWNYVVTTRTMFDLLTNWPSVVAVAVAFGLSPDGLFQRASRFGRRPRRRPSPCMTVYGARVACLLRLLYTFDVIGKIRSRPRRLALTVFATTIVLSTIAAGIFQLSEREFGRHPPSFHDTIFFMIMNIMTVGPASEVIDRRRRTFRRCTMPHSRSALLGLRFTG